MIYYWKEKVVNYGISTDVEIYIPTEILPKYDAIVVTASYFIKEIRKQLGKEHRLICIEDIVNY